MKQDEDQEEMKELDEIRTTHKRSVARRAAKLAEQQAAKSGTNGATTNTIPAPSISPTLIPQVDPNIFKK